MVDLSKYYCEVPEITGWAWAHVLWVDGNVSLARYYGRVVRRKKSCLKRVYQSLTNSFTVFKNYMAKNYPLKSRCTGCKYTLSYVTPFKVGLYPMDPYT